MAFTKEQIERLGLTYEEGMTDDQVFEAISKKQGELTAEKSKFESEAIKNKGLVDKYSSEISTLKKEKADKMTDEEKAKAHLSALENEIATLKKEKSISEKVAKYTKLGYEDELARKVAEGEIEGKDVSEYHSQFLKSHDEALKKQLMSNNPEPNGAGKGGSAWTKEDFKAGKISMEEMSKLKETDPATYQALIS